MSEPSLFSRRMCCRHHNKTGRMTSTVNLIKLLNLLAFVSVISFTTVSGDYSNALSRLYKTAAQSNRPLVLILDDDDASPSRDTLKHNHKSSQDVTDNLLLQLLEGLVKKKKSYSDRPRGEDRNERDRVYGSKDRDDTDRSRQRGRKVQRPRNKDERNGRSHLRQTERDRDDRIAQYRSRSRSQRDRRIRQRNRNSLRSPVLNTLLTLRNSLRCGARDRCQDQCNNQFKDDKKVTKCEDKCEMKFSCDEEEDDPCERGECDDSGSDCGGDEICSGSTKGEILLTERPPCPRC